MMMQKTERLGMISVPWQTYSAPLPPADALCAGTVFRELIQPYAPVSCNQPVMQPMQNMAAMLGIQKKR